MFRENNVSFVGDKIAIITIIVFINIDTFNQYPANVVLYEILETGPNIIKPMFVFERCACSLIKNKNNITINLMIFIIDIISSSKKISVPR